MKYLEARDLLKHALKKQSTIKVSKLAEILQSMNISLKNEEEAPDSELHMLRLELKRKQKELRDLHKKHAKVMKRLKEYEGSQ